MDQSSNQPVDFVWNWLPSLKSDAMRMAIPLGFHYTPGKVIENLEFLDYDPLLCITCKSALNPYSPADFKSKKWTCLFCDSKNNFPKEYAEAISEENLPLEMQHANPTVEYKLNKKKYLQPSFFFIINVSVEETELNEIKEALQEILLKLQPESRICLISYGNHCQVHLIGYDEFQVIYSFKGDKEYKDTEILEILGLRPGNKGPSPDAINQKFVLLLQDYQLNINNILDELQADMFNIKEYERAPNCAGLALTIAVVLSEAVCYNDISRLVLFLGGPTTRGVGKVVGSAQSETIRTSLDFRNKTDNIKFYSAACAYYNNLAQRAMRVGQVIDIYAANFDQVGLKEMKKLVERTGGTAILTDSFSTPVFKDTFKNFFSLNEDGFLKNMNFKGRIEVYTRSPIQFSGGLGSMTSMNSGHTIVSEISVGEGETRIWNIGGFDTSSTYTFILDFDNKPSIAKSVPIQICTMFVAGDCSIRLRVTTVHKPVFTDINKSHEEVSRSFNQDAAIAMMGKMVLLKAESEEQDDILKWLDKTLIRFVSKFAKYTKNVLSSFNLPQQFSYFPQYMFFFRRSQYVQSFNASIDENTFYKLWLHRENVQNCTIMIQPMLFEYTTEKPEPNPIFLDIANMKNNRILLIDLFFYVGVWYGKEVCDWRKQGLQYEEGYEYLADFFNAPQDYAQAIIAERSLAPKLISCDAGSGGERYFLCNLNPASSNSNSKEVKVLQDGFVSDDIDWKSFMDHLIRISIQG